MDTKEYLNILKTEVNKKSIKKNSTQILHEGATKEQAAAKVAEYRKALVDKIESMIKLAPKDKRSNININVLLKDFDKAAPKTIKWLMKNGIPK
jgi:hypothetical protein